MVTLEASKLFNTLSAVEWQPLLNAAQERTFAAGQTIFQEGDLGDGLYIVKNGQVEISALIQEQNRRVLARIPPGDFFGEMAVLDSEPRSASATAQIDTQIYFIPRPDFWQVLQTSPSLAIVLMQEISLRMREFNKLYIQEMLQAERLTLVGRFARTIVHDFKNPLSVISFAGDLIDAEKSTPEQRRTAKLRIRKQVDRLSNMINELLEFTRGSQTAVVLARADFAHYMGALVDDLRAELEPSSVNLVCENPPPAVELLLEPDRLTHVFYNLVHNATDFMPNGGKIILRFAVKDKSLVLEIEDTGPGIAPEIAERLFEPFATFGKAQGTGLGLSICRKIIGDHHGHILARNERGRGAIFTIRLPLAE